MITSKYFQLLCILLLLFIISPHLFPSLYKLDSSSLSLNVSLNDTDIETKIWPNLTGCNHFVTKFANLKTLPMRALASYPGSGNTWSRFVIEAATGIFTGSIWSDPGIMNAGHHGEGRPEEDGSTILQKTHMR